MIKGVKVNCGIQYRWIDIVSISTREAILKVMDSDGFNRDESGQFHHGFTFPIAVVIAAANFDPFHQRVFGDAAQSCFDLLK